MTSMNDKAVCMTCTDVERLTAPPVEGFKTHLVAVLVGLWNGVLLWQHRAEERHHLAQLDERLLRDMGMTRTAVDFEVSKPFWRG